MSERTLTKEHLPEAIRPYIPDEADGLELAVWGFAMIQLRENLAHKDQQDLVDQVIGAVQQELAALTQRFDILAKYVESQTATTDETLKQLVELMLQRGTRPAPNGRAGGPSLASPASQPTDDELVAEMDRLDDQEASVVSNEAPEIELPPRQIPDDILLQPADEHQVYQFALSRIPPHAPADVPEKIIKACQRQMAGWGRRDGEDLKGEPWASFPRGWDDIVQGNLERLGLVPGEQNPKQMG